MSISQILSVLLIALGELCIIISIIGVFRMNYFLNRMHATTIADTMGTLLAFLGVMLQFGFSMVSAKLLLVVIFQWTTAPVSGHMISRMAYTTNEKDMEQHAERTFPYEEEE